MSAGQIVATRDGIGENIPTEPLPPLDIDTAVGNLDVIAFL